MNLDLKLNEYQKLAMRTAKPLSFDANLTHAALGVTSEAGEIATAVKAYNIYGKPLDKANIVEECGDLLWFVALMLDTVGVTMDEAAAMNIGKLQKRYPEKYSDEAGLKRADKND